MKILVTAFDAFGGESLNPAERALELLDDRISEAEIIKLKVPTVFGKSVDTVIRALEDTKPDAVLLIGQAGGRFDVTPERVAINLDDARIADNEGNQPIDKTIAKEGAAAYFSSLPVKAMVREIREGGLPASLSNSAGTFVCNHLMYGVLHHIAKNNLEIRGGFIHVPYAPEQVVDKQMDLASMSLDDITRALGLAIKAIVENKDDLPMGLGKIS